MASKEGLHATNDNCVDTRTDEASLAGHGNAMSADEAMKAFFGVDAETIVLDETTSKTLLRKIDLMLIPLLCLVYGLNFLDKTTLSYTSIMGLKGDIGLVGDDYEWLGSVFYFGKLYTLEASFLADGEGYLGWEYPANRLLQRLPLAKYSGFCIVMWGVVLSCFAAVRSYSGAIAIRFFLGVFEASVTPGFALFTSQWYTKKEHGSRIAIWSSFNGLAQIFGGLVAYGIARDSTHGYSVAPWKVIFLITGLLTIVFGLVFLFIVPDNQLNAWWLSAKDRVYAIERVRVNQQGIGNKHFKSGQFREAILDPLTWAFVFLAIVLDIPNGGLTNFFSQLVESFGFTAQQSLLYGTPAGAVEFITLIVWGILTHYFGNRILLGMASICIALLGIIMIVALPLSNSGGRLAGYFLTQTSVTGFIALLSLISTNVAGYTKKTTVAAFYLMGYCVGNIIGPQTFRPQDAPRYVPAEITIIACYGASIIDLMFIYCYYRRQNTKKEAYRARLSYQRVKNQEWLDLTDQENAEFVYEL